MKGGHYANQLGERTRRPSPTHPALKLPLAAAAVHVQILELGVTAVTITQSMQLYSQLLREAPSSKPQVMGLLEATLSLERNPKIHLRTGQAGARLSDTCTHEPKPLMVQDTTSQ